MCLLTDVIHTLLYVVSTAWRNSVTYGSQGRPGGGGQVSAEEWSNSGCQSTGEMAVI